MLKDKIKFKADCLRMIEQMDRDTPRIAEDFAGWSSLLSSYKENRAAHAVPAGNTGAAGSGGTGSSPGAGGSSGPHGKPGGGNRGGGGGPDPGNLPGGRRGPGDGSGMGGLYAKTGGGNTITIIGSNFYGPNFFGFPASGFGDDDGE